MVGIIGTQHPLSKDIEVSISPEIYDPDHHITILNEVATFVISLDNRANYNRTMSVVLECEGETAISDTFIIGPKSSKQVSYNQRILFTGLWILRVSEITSHLSYWKHIAEGLA